MMPVQLSPKLKVSSFTVAIAVPKSKETEAEATSGQPEF